MVEDEVPRCTRLEEDITNVANERIENQSRPCSKDQHLPSLFERPAFAMGFGAWTLLVGQRARKEKRFRDDGRPRGSFATTRLQHLMNLKRFEANNYSHAKQSIFRVGRDRNIGSWRIKGTPDIRDEMSCNVNGKGWV